MTGGQLPMGSALTENCMHAPFKSTHDAMLLKFQDPAQADQLTSIMRQLDETKLVLVCATLGLRPNLAPWAEQSTQRGCGCLPVAHCTTTG